MEITIKDFNEQEVEPGMHMKGADGEIRCCCGKLQARSGQGSVIIKCGRCKRKIIISLDDLSIKTSG
jgi:hypothetical protein